MVETLEDSELGLEACAREAGLVAFEEVVDLHVVCEVVEHIEVPAVLSKPLSGEMEDVTA